MNRCLLISMALLTLSVIPAAAEDECDALFVIRAQSVNYDGSRLVLHGPDPHITYFCDRPVRSAGHLTLDEMMDLVTEGKNNFTENPPNAAVAIFDPDGSVSDAIKV